MRHLPVLLADTVRLLAPERGGLFVDCTLGLGGHAEAILQAGPEARLLGIDRDPEALALAGERLAPYGDRVRLAHGNFADTARLVAAAGGEPLAGLLADFGVSSLQLDEARRGFSFRRDGPLDMRMDPSTGLTAADILDTWEESDLEQIFRELGEEPAARRIARAVVQARTEHRLERTGELRDLVASVVGSRPPRRDRDRRRSRALAPPPGPRIDPATRVFQALRIAVNAELQAVEQLLAEATNLLAQDGRLVVISYHSLEDRRVKNALRELAQGEKDPVTGRALAETQLLEVLTKKPIRPSDEEVAANPRSRSARLRAARRL
jgi:16S rRNA (cytosine1402-N4)-methyltransferase